MSQTYYTVLTTLGEQLIAEALKTGKKIALTKIAVGDGNGTIPQHTAASTKLVKEWRRAVINDYKLDPQNKNQLIVEHIIPEHEGGNWIREIALYDDTNRLIAIGNCPATYKPKLLEGSGQTQVIRMLIAVSNTDAINLKIEPSTLASRQYVDDKVNDISATKSIFINYGGGREKKYFLLAKAKDCGSDASLATLLLTGGVDIGSYTSLCDLVSFSTRSSSKLGATLDVNRLLRPRQTYDELVYFTRLKDDYYELWVRRPQYTSDVNIQVLMNQAGFITLYDKPEMVLEMPQGLVPYYPASGANELIGVPIPYPSTILPREYLPCNGIAFSADSFPQLAKLYPSLRTPDLRGEFIRGWDNGRNIDSGRALLSWQDSENKSHSHPWYRTYIGNNGGMWSPNVTDKISTGMDNKTLTAANASSAITFSGGNESRPRNMAFNYIMRAR